MAESFSNRLNVAMAFRNVKQIDFVHAAEKFNTTFIRISLNGHQPFK